MAKALSSDLQYKLVGHVFTAIDDPHATDQNGTPKWRQVPGGYMLERTYRSNKPELEFLLLVGQYVEDKLGATGRELWEKQEALTPSERNGLFSVRDLNKHKIEPTRLIANVKLPAPRAMVSCAHEDIAPVSSELQLLLASANWSELSMEIIYTSDSENAGKLYQEGYENLAHTLSQPGYLFFQTLNDMFAQKKPLETYLRLRRCAILNGLQLEMRSIDSVAILIAMLYAKAKKQNVDRVAMDEGKLELWSLLRNGLREWLSTEHPSSTTTEDVKASETTSSEQPYKWSVISDAWQGPFLHVFASNLGFIALQLGFVPNAVINLGLRAFEVVSPPNPEATFRILMDKMLCVPTLIFMYFENNRRYDDAAWDEKPTTLLQKIIRETETPANNAAQLATAKWDS